MGRRLYRELLLGKHANVINCESGSFKQGISRRIESAGFHIYDDREKATES